MAKKYNSYSPSDWGKEEEELLRTFNLQKDDALDYFKNTIKPRLDRSYKLYIAYNGDRAKQIKSWQCVSEDTKILSANGWRSIGELKKGDSVLSYDLETGNILPDTVRDAFSYNVDGDMVSIKNSFTDQLVTTNHRVITKFKKRRYNSKVKGKDKREGFWEDKYNYIEAEKILSQGGTEYRFPRSGFYDGLLSIGEDFAELIGWFITDGSIPKKGSPYITQSKPETLEKLRSLLLSMKVDFREWSRKKSGSRRNGGSYYNEHRFYFSRKSDLMKEIIELIPNRKPVEKLWHIKLSEKRRLLEGIGYGDGSRNPDGSLHMVHKPYEQFKEWLHVFLHLMGMGGTISDKYITIAYSSSVDVNRKKQIKLVRYTGKVWSIATARTNYIACRNGKVFITGNSNVFTPYIQAVVETLMPRVLDARPDFVVQGRSEDDQAKSEKQQQLGDYIWEISKMDKTTEDVVRSSLIYGTGYLQPYWKKDVRTHKFLTTKDLNSKKYIWKEKEKVFYDAPYAEWVDNYSLFYDWHNIARDSKQYWFKRLVLTGNEIKRRYPGADKTRLELAFKSGGGDLTDYASIRSEVKKNHDSIAKGADVFRSSIGTSNDRYNTYGDPNLQMYEVFEWTRPFDDMYSVHVGASYVPILKGGSMPIIYDFKEATFIDFPYLKIPGEFEGYGIPMILENPQIMMNMIKNQRLDSATLSIHKMWIVNPLANINKDELVTRPFGIIYSVDPNGVREVQFSDIKASAYKEEDLLKSDMRYASGIDDFSMGAGGGAGSATEVRHLRESTLERVRLFVNHLGNGFSDLMRYWMDMSRQFFTEDMVIRIVGDDGKELFPLIEKDDLQGNFDYRAVVLPSIAGQNDIKKKQNMDLFQLLINLPFIDPRKLTQKVLIDWNWSLDSVTKSEGEEQPMVGPDGQPLPQEGMEPEMMEPEMPQPPGFSGSQISPEIAQSALAMLRGGEESSPFAQASSPINLLGMVGSPPTASRIPLPTTNPRGMNRGGRVNTTVNQNQNSNPESALMNRASSIQ